MGPTMTLLLINLGNYDYWINKDDIYGYNAELLIYPAPRRDLKLIWGLR